MVDTESLNPGVSKYLEKIESRLNRKGRLAHEAGAGAPCTKCGVKCPGFELHYWRKICLNCRCSKDDHDIKEDDEDIGRIVIGKLINCPDPLEHNKKSSGKKTLQSTPNKENSSTKATTKSKGVILELPSSPRKGGSVPQQFDWVPPNVEPQLAARYMTALPPERRPIAGTQAAKDRKHLLEHQVPLYDFDESRRCEIMTKEEQQQFKAHIENIRTNVVGQGVVSEVHLSPRCLVGKLEPSGLKSNLQPNSVGCAPADAGEVYKLPFGQVNMREGGSYKPVLFNVTPKPFKPSSFAAQEINKNDTSSSPSQNNNDASDDEWPIPPLPLTAPPSLNQEIVKGTANPSLADRLSSVTLEDDNSNFVNPSFPTNVLVGRHRPGNNIPSDISSAVPVLKDSEADTLIRAGAEGSYGTIPSLPTLHAAGGAALQESVHYPMAVTSNRERLTAGVPSFETSSTVPPVLLSSEALALQRTPAEYDPIPVVSDYCCEQCDKRMIVGEVSVICERAGPLKFWHPSCFVCHDCGELLADMIYFWRDGKVYCGRHYCSAAQLPRCHACDELIFSESWTRADGFDWHLSHFTCFLCDKELAGESYVPGDGGQPYCLPCHMTAIAQTCETCEEKISPTSQKCQLRGYHYHATDSCFKCYSCHKPLMGAKLKIIKNWLFCSVACVEASQDDIERNPATKFKHGEEE